MNTKNLMGTLLVLFTILLSGCNNDDEAVIYTIDDLTVDNYPRVDGSTSTEPLNTLIACKLFSWRYEWEPYLAGNGTWRLVPNYDDIPDNFFWRTDKIVTNA